MRFPWPFKRHSRWHEQLDAYADGELDARAVGRLEEHLGGCETCREMVAERKQVKRLAAALPELPAPRSFGITPGMLVEAREAVPARRGATIVMRLGQATAGVGALAFAAVLVAHVSTGGGESGGRQAADEDRGAEAQSLSADGVTGGAGATSGATGSSPLAPEPTPSIPEFDGATVGGASNPPTQSPRTDEGRAYATPSLRDTAQPAAADEEPAADLYDSAARADEDDSDIAFVAAETALGTLVVAALAMWLIARRTRRA